MGLPSDWQKKALYGGALGALAGGVIYALTRTSDSGGGGTVSVPKNAFVPSKAPPGAVWVPKGTQGPSTPETQALIDGSCGALQGFGGPMVCPADRLLGFPADRKARWDYILDKVKNGLYYVTWSPIVSVVGNHAATFWITSDALKIDGVRVEVTATLQQQMADVMGNVSFPTARLLDLAFIQAEITLPPLTRAGTEHDWVADGTMSNTGPMVIQSIDVDRMIIARVGSLDAAKGKLIGGANKAWVLDNDMIGKKADRTEAATNAGWNLWDATKGFTPVTKATNAQGVPMRVWQQPSTKHGRFHDDYSQDAIFVLNDVVVDGQPMKLQDVLTNPVLAPLASHQGVLKTLRQPGVPMVGT